MKICSMWESIQLNAIWMLQHARVFRIVYIYKQNTYFDVGVFYLEYNIKYLKESASVKRHCLDT